MSDAYCGPSNALQSFKEHTSVDRSLQQDRLILRQHPGQGFRSHDSNAGILDPEFEAFQAGPAQAPAFAGPAFQEQSIPHVFQAPSYQFAAGPSQAGPLHVQAQSQSAQPQTPLQAPSWAADFSRLQLSPSPAQSATQWDRHFQQSKGKAPMQSAYTAPAQQWMPNPSLGLTSGFASGQYSHFQQPQAFNQPQNHAAENAQAHVQFDEAAFQRAFDAAMEDAALHAAVEDQPTHPELQYVLRETGLTDDAQAGGLESTTVGKPNMYPHIPLLRIALLRAIVQGTDRDLHEAAKLVKLLGRHDVSQIEPDQAILLRPLIDRLADPGRSHFVDRYSMAPELTVLQQNLTLRERDMTGQWSLRLEELLAAYADNLWGRSQSDHLRDMQQDDADDAAWRTELNRDLQSQLQDRSHVTDQTISILTVSDVFHEPGTDDLRRVLDLEVDSLAKVAATQPGRINTTDGYSPEDLLLDMIRDLRSNVVLSPDGTSAHYAPQVEEYLAQQRMSSRHTTADHETTLSEALQPNQMVTDEIIKDGLVAHQALAGNLGESKTQQDAGQVENLPDGHDVVSLLGEAQPVQSLLQQEQQESQLQQNAQENTQHDDEALAATAADLLDKVQNNRTDKFRNSAFLGLMRKLADREVRVQGDKMVETNGTANSGATAQAPAPTSWHQQGPMQTPPTNTEQAANIDGRDGADVARLLDERRSLTEDQDPEFMMTSPFPSDPLDVSFGV